MKNSVIEILVPKGEPNGLRIIKLAGWIGRAFVIPRVDLSEIKDMTEASYPAVYFLFGEPKNDKPIVYIGQTDKFFRRMNQQNADRDDDNWNVALVFTGESDIDVQYLEKKCVEDAIGSARYTISNSAKPPGRNLSDFRKAVNDDFLEKMKFVTTLLGFPLFLTTPKELQVDNVYILEDVKNKDAQGRGALLPNQEFVVFAGSKARVEETEGFKKHVKSSVSLRKKLESEGILTKDVSRKSYIFTRDYIFSSPSAAADVVMGRACNGWTGWKGKDGKTLDEDMRP